jgi:hypothetical protein
MTEQPAKPESAERELSIDEFLELLRKKFKPNKETLESFRNTLYGSGVRIFKLKNIAKNFLNNKMSGMTKELCLFMTRTLVFYNS